MKILVTGATGLIGRELARKLEHSEHEIFLSSRTTDFRNQPGLASIPADITDPADLQSLISKCQPSVVIHTAAIAAPDQCEIQRELAYAVNVNATKTLLDLSSHYDFYLLLLSTDFVFDGKSGPYQEHDKRAAVNYYGQTKIEAEDLLTSSVAKWGIARTVLSYGQQIPGFRPSFQTMVINNLKQGKPIKLATDQFRTPTYLPDLANGLITMATGMQQGLFHLSGKDIISIYDFGRMVAEIAGLDQELVIPVTTGELSHQATRPLKTGLICEKANMQFGYSPVSLPEGLSYVI